MAEKQGKYIYYTVESDIQLEDLVKDKQSLFYKHYSSTDQDSLLNDFLKITNGTSNLNRIWNNYLKVDQSDYQSDYDNESLRYIRRGTTLIVNEKDSNIETVVLRGKNLFLEQNDLSSYISEMYRVIQNDINNYPSTFVKDSNDEVSVQMKNYHCSVWMYSKALDRIIDVSPFVYSLNTNSNVSTGIS